MRLQSEKLIRTCNTIFLYPKVKFHVGDPTAKLFNQLEDTAKEIFSIADSVIHSGSNVSFLKGTKHQKKWQCSEHTQTCNTLSTLTSFTAFYSFSKVVHLSNKETFNEDSLDASELPIDDPNDYTAEGASSSFLREILYGYLHTSP